MGAWIETKRLSIEKEPTMSHPPWVRGLKLDGCHEQLVTLTSHPPWVRGLKHEAPVISTDAELSHPPWVRGLKLYPCLNEFLERVAPPVGAWIETWCHPRWKRRYLPSHPPWVRGLKHSC